MRKSLRFIVLTLIFMFMSLTILAPAAMAAENPGVEISATVALSGTLPATPESFPIKLSADEVSNPMPEGSLNGVSTMTITGAGTVTFPKITFARVGIYNYTIWQQSGLDPDWIYDTTIYHLTVFVTNAAGGGLEVVTVLHRDGETEKSPAILFNNRHANPAQVKFLALKTLDGATPADGKFTFNLTDDAGSLLQSKTNLGQSVEFDALLLNKAGTHSFFLREQIVNDGKINYDAVVYKATVVVTKNSDGNYSAVFSYERAGSPFTGTPIFANTTITGELPFTGTAQSTLPILGAVLILGGVALALRRKKVD